MTKISPIYYEVMIYNPMRGNITLYRGVDETACLMAIKRGFSTENVSFVELRMQRAEVSPTGEYVPDTRFKQSVVMLGSGNIGDINLDKLISNYDAIH